MFPHLSLSLPIFTQTSSPTPLEAAGCRFSVITSRILHAKTSTFVIYLPFSRRFFVMSKRGGMIGFMMRAIACSQYF
jgi:hypothetical protein